MEHKIALAFMTEREFINIKIDSKDRNLLKFLWLSFDTIESSNLLIYRLTRVIFGVNFSPFCLKCCFKQPYRIYEEEYTAIVLQLRGFLYVDNLVPGNGVVDNTLSIFGKSRARMLLGKLRLHKWTANYLTS